MNQRTLLLINATPLETYEGCLEELKQLLQEDFETLKHFIYKVPGKVATSYPDPVWGCLLLVRQKLDGGYVAFPTGEDAGINEEDVVLTDEDVQMWSLDVAAVKKAVGI